MALSVLPWSIVTLLYYMLWKVRVYDTIKAFGNKDKYIGHFRTKGRNRNIIQTLTDEHNIAFLTANHFIQHSKLMFPDSKVALGVLSGKAKQQP